MFGNGLTLFRIPSRRRKSFENQISSFWAASSREHPEKNVLDESDFSTFRHVEQTFIVGCGWYDCFVRTFGGAFRENSFHESFGRRQTHYTANLRPLGNVARPWKSFKAVIHFKVHSQAPVGRTCGMCPKNWLKRNSEAIEKERKSYHVDFWINLFEMYSPWKRRWNFLRTPVLLFQPHPSELHVGCWWRTEPYTNIFSAVRIIVYFDGMDHRGALI